MFSMKCMKENIPRWEVGKLSFSKCRVPARVQLEQVQGRLPECEYISTLGADDMCYVTEKNNAITNAIAHSVTCNIYIHKQCE